MRAQMVKKKLAEGSLGSGGSGGRWLVVDVGLEQKTTQDTSFRQLDGDM